MVICILSEPADGKPGYVDLDIEYHFVDDKDVVDVTYHNIGYADVCRHANRLRASVMACNQDGTCLTIPPPISLADVERLVAMLHKKREDKND